jgi:hypothetical protein
MDSIRKLLLTWKAVSVNRKFGVKAKKTFSEREILVRNIRGITNNNDNKIIIRIIIRGRLRNCEQLEKEHKFSCVGVVCMCVTKQYLIFRYNRVAEELCTSVSQVTSSKRKNAELQGQITFCYQRRLWKSRSINILCISSKLQFWDQSTISEYNCSARMRLLLETDHYFGI